MSGRGVRVSNRLSHHNVRKLPPGRHRDGNGLQLFVKDNGTRYWIMRVTVHGKRCDIGLGSADHVRLAEARAEAESIRAAIRAGRDPLVERRRAETVPTFADAAERVWNSRSPTWRNAKHSAQWLNTLRTYAFPVFGDVRINAVTSAHVLRAIDPIWHQKPETAKRTLQRIREVFRWAKAAGHHQGDNPADEIRPALGKQKVEKRHHAALPWQELPAFYVALEQRSAISAHCLQFAILTAARSGEARGACWEEIDVKAKIWTIPASRMKSKREHRVPLPDLALDVLRAVGDGAQGEGLIFPGPRGRMLSDMTFTALFRRLECEGITAHGFRSTFRDWCSECTSTPREVAELALAHVVGDAVERAYARSDLFDRRRELMDAWSDYVGLNRNASR